MTRRERSMSRVARRNLILLTAGGAAALIAGALRITARSGALKMSPVEARLALDDGHLIVLDVRTDRERAGGTIPGAVATSWRHPQRPASDRDVLVVCSHGGRSLSAAHTLHRRGVDARSLKGGMKAYVRDCGGIGSAVANRLLPDRYPA